MEGLYSKLYDKYTKLKQKEESKIGQLARDQELKFMDYVTVAEELIEFLRNENDRLKFQINDLRSEVTSIRSNKDKQYAEYQKLLMEENKRNAELSEEVENLRKLREQDLSCSREDDKIDSHLRTPGEGDQVALVSISHVSNKRRRVSAAEKPGASTPVGDKMEHVIPKESSKDVQKGTMSPVVISNIQQAACCTRDIDRSGGGFVGSDSANCLFHALFECLVGMKLSITNQSEGPCISAIHQSSGYSFSLTWVNQAAKGEIELLYRASSLGTFKRVAPEWMRDILMFSMSMCPIFLQRVSLVVNRHH